MQKTMNPKGGEGGEVYIERVQVLHVEPIIQHIVASNISLNNNNRDQSNVK